MKKIRHTRDYRDQQKRQKPWLEQHPAGHRALHAHNVDATSNRHNFKTNDFLERVFARGGGKPDFGRESEDFWRCAGEKQKPLPIRSE